MERNAFFDGNSCDIWYGIFHVVAAVIEIAISTSSKFPDHRRLRRTRGSLAAIVETELHLARLPSADGVYHFSPPYSLPRQWFDTALRSL